MANTITQQTLVGSGSDKVISRVIHIVSDGTEEVDLVIFQNSSFINDVTKGRLRKVRAMGSPCNLRLEWKQTTDAIICDIDPYSDCSLDFIKTGGGENPVGAGATGNIVLTTQNLDLNDEVTLFIEVVQS
jgi:hypothetical protein